MIKPSKGVEKYFNQLDIHIKRVELLNCHQKQFAVLPRYADCKDVENIFVDAYYHLFYSH